MTSSTKRMTIMFKKDPRMSAIHRQFDSLLLGVFLIAAGCQDDPARHRVLPENSSRNIEHQEQAAEVAPAEIPVSKATRTDVKALTDRLKQITDEVAETPERRVYGVHVPASLQADERTSTWIHAVTMSVNVYWCDDGCVDGPAETPARDEDLLLLRPFAESLRTLDVQHTEMTDAGLRTIAELTSLERLNLAGTAVQGTGLDQLASLIRLRSLDLRDTAILPEHVSSLSALTSLHEIDLPASALSDESLAALSRLPNLRRLNLAQAPVSDRGLAHLASLKHLERLDLSETKITNAGLKGLSGMTDLRQLHLTKTGIDGSGLVHLSGLKKIQELNLDGTSVDDSGLVSLAGMAELETLNLAGTPIQGRGLVHLKSCRSLREAVLPPISVRALAAVNAVKSWRSLSLTLVRSNDPASPGPASAAGLDDMPELEFLRILCDSPLEELHIENCPKLIGVSIEHAAGDFGSERDAPQFTHREPLPPTSLHMRSLPALRSLHLSGWFDALTGDDAISNIERVSIDGAVTSETVRGIGRCRGIVDLNLSIARLSGDPLPVEELLGFQRTLRVRISAETPEAAWLTRLIGNMPALKNLDLRIPGLTSSDLNPLTRCPEVEQLIVRGIDDPGEPLTFLNAMPKLDQCLVLGCPRVGRIRLTSETGVRRLYFKYGRLDALEIEGAPHLTAVHLGHDAHGYNDEDARLSKLDLTRLTLKDVPVLQYLMVDGGESTTALQEMTLNGIPKLRSLLLRASDRQPQPCRLKVEGTFPELEQYRLFRLITDQASLDRWHVSPVLHRSELTDVDVDPDGVQ